MTPELRGDCPEQTVRSTVSQSTRACLAVSYYFFARLLDWAVFRYGSSVRISVLFAYHLEQVYHRRIELPRRLSSIGAEFPARGGARDQCVYGC